MINKITMYSASCDICNNTYELWDGCVALNEKSAIKEDIIDAGEWTITESGKTYCADCCTRVWDEEGEKQYAVTKDTESSGATLLGVAI